MLEKLAGIENVTKNSIASCWKLATIISAPRN